MESYLDEDGNIKVEVLRELLDYNPETGEFVWKERDPKWFKEGKRSRDSYARPWNKNNAGKKTFNHSNGTRKGVEAYKFGVVFGIQIASSHAAWAIAHGEWPEGVVRCRNGVNSDLRLANLESTSRSRARLLGRASVASETGYRGVSFCTERKKFVAVIGEKGILKNLGRFDSLDEALAARFGAIERRLTNA